MTLLSKQVLWKTETFLKKLEFHFLFESTTTESANISIRNTEAATGGVL